MMTKTNGYVEKYMKRGNPMYKKLSYDQTLVNSAAEIMS